MQRVIGLLLVFALVTQALAGTLLIPLTASKLNSDELPLSNFASLQGGVTKPTFKNNGMMVYTTKASIGTPAQTLTFSFDLTYSDALIAGTNCSTSTCKDRTLFNQKKSTSFQNVQNDNVDNTTRVGSDTVKIAGAILNDFTFSISSNFNLAKNNPSSGVFGLGSDQFSKMGTPNLLSSLVSSGAITQSLFSIYLDPQQNSQTSFVLFGGTDETKYLGRFHYRPLTSSRYWAVRLVSITLDGERVHYCNNPCRAIFSTIDPYIYGPPVYVRKINNALNISQDCSNYYTRPRLVFHLGPHYLSIPRSSYINRVGDKCESLLQEGSILRENWVLGNLFLRSYYTVFDRDNLRIGWAPIQPTVETN